MQIQGQVFLIHNVAKTSRPPNIFKELEREKKNFLAETLTLVKNILFRNPCDLCKNFKY